MAELREDRCLHFALGGYTRHAIEGKSRCANTDSLAAAQHCLKRHIFLIFHKVDAFMKITTTTEPLLIRLSLYVRAAMASGANRNARSAPSRLRILRRRAAVLCCHPCGTLCRCRHVCAHSALPCRALGRRLPLFGRRGCCSSSCGVLGCPYQRRRVGPALDGGFSCQAAPSPAGDAGRRVLGLNQRRSALAPGLPPSERTCCALAPTAQHAQQHTPTRASHPPEAGGFEAALAQRHALRADLQQQRQRRGWGTRGLNAGAEVRRALQAHRCAAQPRSHAQPLSHVQSEPLPGRGSPARAHAQRHPPRAPAPHTWGSPRSVAPAPAGQERAEWQVASGRGQLAEGNVGRGQAAIAGGAALQRGRAKEIRSSRCEPAAPRASPHSAPACLQLADRVHGQRGGRHQRTEQALQGAGGRPGKDRGAQHTIPQPLHRQAVGRRTRWCSLAPREQAALEQQALPPTIGRPTDPRWLPPASPPTLRPCRRRCRHTPPRSGTPRRRSAPAGGRRRKLHSWCVGRRRACPVAP